MVKFFISIDMDETLLHSAPQDLCSIINIKPAGIIPGERPYNVYLRPGVIDMLKELEKIGTLNLFSYGARDYVIEALSITKLISFFPVIFTREDIKDRAIQISRQEWNKIGIESKSDASYIKDLRIVNKNTNYVIAIDDSVDMYPMFFSKNVIQVTKYDTRNSYFLKDIVEPIVLDMSKLVLEKMAIL